MQRILSNREKKTLYITIGVIIFAASFNLLSETVIKRNDALNKEINITQVKLKKYSWLLAHKEPIQNKYGKFTSGAGLFEEGKGKEKRKDTLVELLTELETIAKDSNIRIIDLRPQAQREIDLYSEAVIDLRTEGAMEGYLKFIYNIENSLSLLRIKRFQLNAKPNTQDLEGSFSILRSSIF